MRASLAACILADLLATGACLQCEVCKGPGTSCTGDLQTCTAGSDSCAIALREKTVAGVKSHTIVKTCATPSECKAGLLSLTKWNGETMRRNISCCVGDACRAITVTLPPADPKPNGRRCSGCIYLTSGDCKRETTECTGAETQCFYSIKRKGGDAPFDILHGCATESFCAMGMMTFDFVEGNSVVPIMNICTTACDTAGTELAGVLVSASAGILLLKLLSRLCG